MALPLNDTGIEMRDMLPAFMREDPNALGVLDVMAREIDRVDAHWQDLIDQFAVETATWGLKYWEQFLQLPVEPVGVSDADRRAALLSKLISNKVASAAQFTAVIDAISPTNTVSFDCATTHLTVEIVFNPGDDYTEGLVNQLIEQIRPAHVTYNVQFDAFIAGVSTAGDSL